MSYEDEKLFYAKIETDHLRKSSSQIEQALRKRLGLSSVDETDLTLADFEYWLPNAVPTWDNAPWQTYSHTDICFEIRLPFQHIVELYNVFDVVDLPSSMISVHFDELDVRCCKDGVVLDAPNQQSLCIVPQKQMSQDIGKGKELYRAFARVVGFEEFLQEIPNGFVVPKLDGILPESFLKWPKPIVMNGREMSYGIEPRSLDLESTRANATKLRELFFATLESMSARLGKPTEAYFSVTANHKIASECAALCRQIAPRWDIRFFSEYRQGFDPFARPAEVKDELMYPVVRRVKDDFLELQVTVCHAMEESYLLLHTQRDESFLRMIAVEAGVELQDFGIKQYHELAPQA